MDPERPRVVVSVGTSVDGRVALNRQQVLLDPDAHRVYASTAAPSAAAVEEARSAELERRYQAGAVLEGSGTFVLDDVGPVEGLPPVDSVNDLYEDFRPEEVTPEKWFTVVDGRGRVHWDQKGGSDFHLLVLVARSTPAEYLAYLRSERIPYLVAGEERVDLLAALRRMQTKLGVNCVLSKAGGGLNGALLRAGLVDELHIVISPALIGGLGTPTAFDGPPLGINESPTQLRLQAVRTETDGTLWLSYEVVR